MSKAEQFEAKAEQAEQQALKFPRLRAQYLFLANIWRALARQTRFMDGSISP